MFVLPSYRRRASVLAFWWILNLAVMIVLSIITLAFFQPLLLLYSIPFVVLLLFTGLKWNSLPVFVYRAWAKIDSMIVSKICRMVLLVIIYSIFTVVSVAGSILRLSRPDIQNSMWSPASQGNEYSMIMKQKNDKKWIRPFLYWARTSGNLWIFLLLPFLLLLSVFQEQKTETITSDSNVYTLF